MSDIALLERLQIDLQVAHNAWQHAREYLDHAMSYLQEAQANPHWGDMHTRAAQARIFDYGEQERHWAGEVDRLLCQIARLRAAEAQRDIVENANER